MPDALDPLSLIASHVPGILFQLHRAADGFSAFPYVSGRSLPVIGLEPAELMRNAEALLRRIDVTSAPGAGSAFRVTLPVFRS